MKSLSEEITADLDFAQAEEGGSRLLRILTNRGFHALVCFRIAHRWNGTPLALAGIVLTRLCQIAYGIDIDPRAEIAGGILIYHGVGLVIGSGARLEEHIILFHGVTLGRKFNGKRDGFPHIESGVMIGAGAKLLGALRVGRNSIVGANAVVTFDVPPKSIVKAPASVVVPRAEVMESADVSLR